MLQDECTYRSADGYLAAVCGMIAHLKRLNASQKEYAFSLGAGVCVNLVDYRKSDSIVEYARRAFKEKNFLSLLAESSLDGAGDAADLVFLSAHSPEELLFAALLALHLKARNPRAYICLYEHGYENFSLQPHLSELERNRHFLGIFESILVGPADVPEMTAGIVKCASSDVYPCGILRRADVPGLGTAPQEKGAFPRSRPLPTFSPMPILWTRLNQERCYWGRCSFCVQNHKHGGGPVGGSGGMEDSLRRLQTAREAGYRHVILSDEALSPGRFRELSARLLLLKLDLRWACRIRFDGEFRREDFFRAKEAGCFEALLGLESVSPRVQRLMNKYPENLERKHIEDMLAWMREAGLGSHVNILGGFPGETVQELEDTVGFVAAHAKVTPNMTLTCNCFELFPGSEVAEDPNRYGIEVRPFSGDVARGLSFSVRGEGNGGSRDQRPYVDEMRQRLFSEAGWGTLLNTEEGMAALGLYMDSGHGAVFKSMLDNVFEASIKGSACRRSS